MQHKTKFIICKPLALQEATVSMHNNTTEYCRSYCRFPSKTIPIAQA